MKHEDHIDPIYSKNKKHGFALVCGLSCTLNYEFIDFADNVRKSDAFVPYRVKHFPPPRVKGDLCEFWISGKWRVTPFLGDHWWYEAQELGYSKSDLRQRAAKGGRKNKGRTAPNKGLKRKNPYPKLKWINDGSKNRKIKAEEPIPIGWQTGRITNNLIRNSNGTFKSKNS